MAGADTGRTGSTLRTPRIDANSWVILLVVALGFFMILLDTTIVNVAIPSIITALHASLDQVLWVLNAYILVYAVLLITAGRLGDMYGPKKLFMTGLVLFTIASAACGLAQAPNQLILFRVIQGIGGALLTPQSMAIITSIFPPEKRGAAFGVWGGVAGVAAVTGPTLGGFLTTSISWRAIFYVNVPIGIVTIILAWLVMPEVVSNRRHHLDVPGILIVSGALFALVFGLIEGQRYDWGPIWSFGEFSVASIHAGIVSIPTLIAAGVLLLAFFIYTEIHEAEPLLPIGLFRDRNFTLANIISGIVAFGMLGLFLPMTIFLQSVRGLDALHAGFVFVPMSLVSMVVAPFSGRLVDRISGKYVLVVGMLLFAAGLLIVVFVSSLSSTGLTYTPALVVAGLGMGMTFAPLMTLAMRNIHPSQAGSASGFINTTRQVGGAMGSAVVGAVLENRLANELHAQALTYAARLPVAARSQFVSSFAHAARGGLHVGRGEGGTRAHPGAGGPVQYAHELAALAKVVFDHAFLNAMKPSLGLALGFMALGSVVALFMRTSRHEAARSERSPAIEAAGD